MVIIICYSYSVTFINHFLTFYNLNNLANKVIMIGTIIFACMSNVI